MPSLTVTNWEGIESDVGEEVEAKVDIAVLHADARIMTIIPRIRKLFLFIRIQIISSAPLAFRAGKLYNLSHSEVVRARFPDREGDARWKSPQENSAEVV